MSKLQKVEPQSGAREGERLPQIGEWYWVKVESEYDGEKRRKKPVVEEWLLCVEHVASNHVVFSREQASEHHSGWTQQVRVALCDLLAEVRPAPEWREVIADRMEKARAAIDAATRELREAGVKTGAIDDVAAPPCAVTETSAMLPAIRVSDPVKQKKQLVELKDQLPIVAKRVGLLTQQYCALAKMTAYPELFTLQAMKKRLSVVEDKIFTLEVYAGLQETVRQIADGKPAPIAEPIAIRQAMRFMDEETLLDYDDGGMDFAKLSDFDEWLVKSCNLNRILPEKRGVCAFQIRRNRKDYGPVTSLWEAWAQCEKHEWNFTTYLVIRNGERVYRIASEVDFAPRLIPLRTEFDDAFVKKAKWHDEKDKRITPQDFAYDEFAEELFKNLRGYNRIVVLIQGLLDRSECFHPHAPINLASEASMHEWLRFIRDEEDCIDDGAETWAEYRERVNRMIVKGTVICTGNFRDLKKRPYDCAPLPKFIAVAKVRKGTKRDAIPEKLEPRTYRVINPGRDESECVGVPGVEVEWPQGTRSGYEHGDWGRYGTWPVDTMLRAWIPLSQCVNYDAYKAGDYRAFAQSTTQKRSYLEWAPTLFRCEDRALGRPPREERRNR